MRFITKVVLASPQNVDWMGYKPKRMNESMYFKLSKDKRKKPLEEIESGVTLYSLPDKYAVLDEKHQRILYLIQFKVARVFGKKGITQVQVWRDKTASSTEGLAKKIFFNYLFPTADCIVTDRQQTSYGRAFWELRIYEAFGKGLPVYLLDQNQTTKKRLSSVEEFDDLADSWWGDHPKFQGRKIAICHDTFW